VPAGRSGRGPAGSEVTGAATGPQVQYDHVWGDPRSLVSHTALRNLWGLPHGEVTSWPAAVRRCRRRGRPTCTGTSRDRRGEVGRQRPAGARGRCV